MRTMNEEITTTEAVPTTTLPGSIFIDARQWHDKVNGNTYFSAIVTVDGEWQFTTGMTYGYGDHSVSVCLMLLTELGIIPKFDGRIAGTYALRSAGCHLYVAKSYVLKRELPKAATRVGA